LSDSACNPTLFLPPHLHKPLKSIMALGLQNKANSVLSENLNHPMKIRSLFTVIGTATLAFFAVSCDSARENAREDVLEQKADNLEDTADQVRKRGEAAADAKEDRTDATQSYNRSLDNKDADTTRRATENRADTLEEKADEVREQK
jgi:hypothetical protein